MKVKKTSKGKKKSGRTQPQATGTITMTQLRLMLNRCVAEPIDLIGVVGRDDFEPTWTDVRTAFLGGYKAALKDVIELAGGNSAKFNERMKEGYLQLPIADFPELANPSLEGGLQEIGQDIDADYTTCWKCGRPTSLANDCPSCGAPSLAVEKHRALQDASMDGATAGRADYLAGRKHGHSLKKFERELLATGIGEEEPDFWKIYWNTFVSAYENGWNLEKSRA